MQPMQPIQQPADALQRFEDACALPPDEAATAFEQLAADIEHCLSTHYTPAQRALYPQAAVKSTQSTKSVVRCRKDEEYEWDERYTVKEQGIHHSSAVPPSMFVFPPKPTNRPREQRVRMSEPQRMAEAFNPAFLSPPFSSPFPDNMFSLSPAPRFVHECMKCLHKVLELQFLTFKVSPWHGDVKGGLLQYVLDQALEFLCKQVSHRTHINTQTHARCRTMRRDTLVCDSS